MRWLAFAVLVCATLLGGTPEAFAFERSAVDDQPDRHLFWRYRSVRVHPAYATSEELSPANAAAVISRSIDTWNGAAQGCPSDFLLLDSGPPTSTSTNLEGGAHDGENRIVWRETWWPDEVDASTLALTTSVYRRTTGQILDADIDLNGVDHTWTDNDDPTMGLADAENTLTHELGHLLGLAHVSDPEATMFASSQTGEVAKRSLSEDDIAGLCFVYPEGRVTPGAPIDGGQPLSSGCAARPGQSTSPWTLLALGALLSCLRRRRGAAR